MSTEHITTVGDLGKGPYIKMHYTSAIQGGQNKEYVFPLLKFEIQEKLVSRLGRNSSTTDFKSAKLRTLEFRSTS